MRLPALELLRPHTTITLSTSTRSHRTIVHHCLQCWSFAHFRSAYRLRWAPAAAVAATVERLAACVWMCVRLCVHCGQLEPAVPPEKTALNFVENSANASQNAIFFSGAARRRPSAGRREKKLRFLGKKCDLANLTFFCEKNRMGGLLCRVLVGYLASVCACGQPLARLCWPKFPGILGK